MADTPRRVLEYDCWRCRAERAEGYVTEAVSVPPEEPQRTQDMHGKWLTDDALPYGAGVEQTTAPDAAMLVRMIRVDPSLASEERALANITALESRISTLTQSLTANGLENYGLSNRLDEANAEVVRLTAENKTLRKDSARLDWLDAQGKIWHRELLGSKRHLAPKNIWELESDEWATLREAIDAALSLRRTVGSEPESPANNG